MTKLTKEDRKLMRQKAGFKTMKAYAEYLGLHKSTVANIECGMYTPKKWYDLLLQHEVEWDEKEQKSG